jgi:hypothetical protein
MIRLIMVLSLAGGITMPLAAQDTPADEIAPLVNSGRPGAAAVPEAVAAQQRTAAPRAATVVATPVSQPAFGEAEAAATESVLVPSPNEEQPQPELAGDRSHGTPHAASSHGAHHAHDECSACSGSGCEVCRGVRSPLSGLYGHVQYLYWWTDGMYVPALVTTSPDGTARTDAGVRSALGTEVLFGEESINGYGRAGGRVTLGYWFGGGRQHAIEGDYFALGDAKDNYFNSSTGSPILSRPYFDIVDGEDNAQLVAFPNVLSGSITVEPLTRFLGAGLRKRWNICGCEGDPCDPCSNSCFTDFTIGYRMLKLQDRLYIREDLTSLDTANPGSFVVQDRFNTWNTFHGLEIGVVYARSEGPWSVELLNRLSLGTTQSRVEIAGSTDATQNGVTTTGAGGLLTQTSNIGEYEHDSFAVAPELGITFGYRFNRVWKGTFGYNFIYWSSVLRAGDAIDTDVNTSLIPPQGVIIGPLRPRYEVDETDFYAMGLNFGLEANW